MIKKMSNIYRLVSLSFITLICFACMGFIFSTTDITWSIFAGGILSLLNIIVVSSAVSKFIKINYNSNAVSSIVLYLFKFTLLISIIWLLFKFTNINVIGFSMGLFAPIIGAVTYPLLRFNNN